ncbi:hrp65 protein-like isoform X2 [Sitophilus oryzae]|uniref:Hrp65 protein-like isoform X2 n=1 Tax=Sitophilus oryzae TaxID=7048 RepID=A0A6J2XUH8_SITOR|nr:hrp65 protein-like isoform X2 [Sitophilus oryzae]
MEQIDQTPNAEVDKNEDVESSSENKKYYPRKRFGRKYRDRDKNQNDEIESNNSSGYLGEYHGNFGVDKIEEKIANLSRSPTLELPALNLSEKKFSGRNRLFIGNIGKEINEEDIKGLLDPNVEITDIYVNAEKSFAFVKFDYHSNAEKAQQQLDGMLVKSRVLKVKFASCCHTIKVKNLSPAVTNELLFVAFSVFGEIEKAIVLVDERGKSTGEGLIDFVRKNSAYLAVQRCLDRCYYLTASLKPVIAEPYQFVDQNIGLLDKHFSNKHWDFCQDRSVGPHLAEEGSFEHEYGTKWKAIYELHRQKEEALKVEFRLECSKLEAQMEYARYEHETDVLREQLRIRERDKERQKWEWEAKERLAKEEKLRTEAFLRHAQEEVKNKLNRQKEQRNLMQEEESLFLKAQDLTKILDNHRDFDVPTSSTRENTSDLESFTSYRSSDQQTDIKSFGSFYEMNNNSYGDNNRSRDYGTDRTDQDLWVRSRDLDSIPLKKRRY